MAFVMISATVIIKSDEGASLVQLCQQNKVGGNRAGRGYSFLRLSVFLLSINALRSSRKIRYSPPTSSATSSPDCIQFRTVFTLTFNCLATSSVVNQSSSCGIKHTPTLSFRLIVLRLWCLVNLHTVKRR